MTAYPCANCDHYPRSHRNDDGGPCWCGCTLYRQLDLKLKLIHLIDELNENALDLESIALDAESRRFSTSEWQRRLASGAWSFVRRLREVVYACPECGHSTEPLGPGSDGDHSEDDGRCFTCGKDCAAIAEHREDWQTVLCRLECPDCGEQIPVGVKPGEVVDGELLIESDLSEVWAHAWTHEGDDR